MTISKASATNNSRQFWRRLRIGFFLAGWLALGFNARAAKQSEEQSFSVARALFNDHQYNLAETNLARFLGTYTNSTFAPYAVLYLARSRLEQSNYDGAVQLLTGRFAQAGDLAAEYVFWIATARLDKGQYSEAAGSFANLVKYYTATPRRLEAAYDEAEARSKLGDWRAVVTLLQQTNGVFSRLAGESPRNPYVTRGRLLLGEALLAEGKFAEGERVVNGINIQGLDGEWQWRRQFLLCRLELAGGRPLEALQNSAKLLDAAYGPRHLAASRFLRGEILEKLNRPSEALQVYTNNLSSDLPPEDQRRALLKTVAVTLSQNQAQDAVQFLEAYVTQQTNGPAADLAHLSLGELYLKLYFLPDVSWHTNDLTAAQTNLLDLALTNFQSVLRDFPQSALAPQAHLDRGWCFWAQTNMVSAGQDFKSAADNLALSPSEAVARFKFADTELYLRHYPAAVSNYNLLLTQYAASPVVTNELFDQVLYQIVEASLAAGDQATAQAAVQKIIDWYPNSLFGDRGELLIGESRKYDYAMARRLFSDLLSRSPNTPLLPKVEYAIAQTYEQQGNWQEALRKYDQWVKAHATNAPSLLPQVEYSRALVYGKAGMESNALILFTNFVARFPSNSLSAWAQNWVADFYFNHGDNISAESSYQLLFQKFPNAGDLPFQAALMAGRAALARQDAAEARRYFSDLVANTLTPSNLVAQAWFALGDTIHQQFLDNPGNITNLDDAISALCKITNGAPTNELAIEAYGRLGDYYMEWADHQWDQKHDPSTYTNAVVMYQTLLNFPAADVDFSARCEAEVALGRVAEKEDQTDLALSHYCKVLYEIDQQRADPFWVEYAGKAAGRIYEHLQQWDKAVRVYQRVEKAVPSLRGTLEKLIINAEADADKARN